MLSLGKIQNNCIIQLASLNKKLVINETFRDKEAKIIISAIGEPSSSQALDFIDFNLIEKQSKDNHLIDKISLEITKNKIFNNILDYFGHYITNFCIFPIGINSQLDTKN